MTSAILKAILGDPGTAFGDPRRGPGTCGTHPCGTSPNTAVPDDTPGGNDAMTFVAADDDEQRRRDENRRVQAQRQTSKANKAMHYFGTDSTLAFPTEGRERQKVKEKERKLAGIEVKRKMKDIEDHVDDCGSDLSGLGPDIGLSSSRGTSGGRRLDVGIRR